MSADEVRAFKAGLEKGLRVGEAPKTENKDSLFNTGVRPAIDEYLKEQSEKVRDYGDYWSASSAGYCMRKNIFDRLQVPKVDKDSDARTTRVFEAGHIFHQWIQELTKKAGLSIAQEVELIDEGLKIKGHFDDLVLVRKPSVHLKPDIQEGTEDGVYELKDRPQEVNIMDDSHLILYDYKTAHSKWFEYVKDRPMSHYNKMQLGTYMYMLRKSSMDSWVEKNKDAKTATEIMLTKPMALTEARILKISKDDLRQHEMVLMWSEGLEKEVVEYWKTLNGYWKAKQFPECTCAKYEINKKTGKGFMADQRYNPYYYEGEPCSLAWFAKHGTDDWS